jgi:hypothetical protein
MPKHASELEYRLNMIQCHFFTDPATDSEECAKLASDILKSPTASIQPAEEQKAPAAPLIALAASDNNQGKILLGRRASSAMQPTPALARRRFTVDSHAKHLLDQDGLKAEWKERVDVLVAEFQSRLTDLQLIQDKAIAKARGDGESLLEELAERYISGCKWMCATSSLCMCKMIFWLA